MESRQFKDTVNFKSSMTKTIDELERGGGKRARISLLSAKMKDIGRSFDQDFVSLCGGSAFFSLKQNIHLANRQI
jgi:hypothetical protein